jgi:hypothetical protein
MIVPQAMYLKDAGFTDAHEVIIAVSLVTHIWCLILSRATKRRSSLYPYVRSSSQARSSGRMQVIGHNGAATKPLDFSPGDRSHRFGRSTCAKGFRYHLGNGRQPVKAGFGVLQC